MSGHSHWAGIKHKKELTDAKRAKFFTKAGRLITVAARKGGPDPNTNPTLRLAIEKAREVNMPKVNIERAIERATGKNDGKIMEEVAYEAFGPSGVAIIIKGVTDNKNRAIGDIRKIITKNGGRIADSGSVSWMFETKSRIAIKPANLQGEDLELVLIEAGAEEIKEAKETGEIFIYCDPEFTQNIQKKLSDQNIETSQPELEMIPKQTIEIDEKTQNKIEKLLEELEECDDVTEVFTNF